MDHLTVYYDGHCPICVRCARWLERASTHVPLVVVDSHGAAAKERCRGLRALGAELVVASDDGRAWVGPAAFLVTFWAVQGLRTLVDVVVRAPSALAFALRVLRWVSDHRGELGRALGAPACAHGGCGLPHAVGPYR